MNKMKYLAAVLIAVAGMGLQQAQAHLLDPDQFFTDNPIGSGEDEANFLIATGRLDADCQFGAKFESDGGVSGDFSQYFTVNFAGNTATITWDLTGTGFTLGGVLIKDGAVDEQQLYRFYGVSADEQVVGSDTVTFDDPVRDISHISFFVCPGGGQVPDGGTTVMLLGAALGSLGMARRFLKR
jgi:hypothetical protein